MVRSGSSAGSPPRDTVPQPEHPSAAPAAKPRDASLAQVAGAVFWSFFGVRKGRHMQQDALRIRPHQVVIVGLLAGLLFVLALLTLVSFITRSAG